MNTNDSSALSVNDKVLDVFVETLIDNKGLTFANDDLRAKFEEKIKDKLIDQINHKVLMALPDDKLDEFDRLLDEEASDMELSKIIIDSGVDVNSITVDTIEKFAKAFDSLNGKAEA